MFGIQNRIVFGAAVIALASSGLTAWLVSPGGGNNARDRMGGYDIPVTEQPASAAPGDPALADKLAQIDRRIENINKRLTGDASDRSPAATPGQADANTSSTTPADVVQELRRQVNQTANRFQVEERDAAWSSQMTSKIQDAFMADGIVGNSALSSVDCRSSTCRLDVSYKDSNSLIGVRAKLLEKVGMALPYGAMQPTGSGNEVTIYLGKDAGTFR